MRTLATIATAVALVVLAVVFLGRAPTTGPEPIAYGRDSCAHCRMPLTRPGVAGELRDRDGILTTYDDIGCLLRAMLAQREEMQGAWVEDHTTLALVPLAGATLVRTGAVETPMASGLVAFASAEEAEAFARAHDGELVALETLLRDPARLAAADGHAHSFSAR
jgi:copper chaperone NosL